MPRGISKRSLNTRCSDVIWLVLSLSSSNPHRSLKNNYAETIVSPSHNTSKTVEASDQVVDKKITKRKIDIIAQRAKVGKKVALPLPYTVRDNIAVCMT